jgi:chemotaxis protein MotA
MKDRFTLFAILGALGCVFVSMFMEGSNPMVLFKPAPLLLVFGGTFFVAVAGYLKSDAKSFKSVFSKAMGGTAQDMGQNISRLIELAEVARREGLLALEKAATEVEDPFFKRGIEMTVDGNDPEEIRDILEGEIVALQQRHKAGAKFFGDMGGYAPTLGILGTVIGLIHVLANLSNPQVLGGAIAEAFTATLWGVLSANLFWLPISNKLKRASEVEAQSRFLVMDGILAIQAGNSPRMVQSKLLAYLPPKDRDDVRQQKAA